ncbi:uncharacterized protein RAG0_13624 [Rhynchosporium agropyri]|uniref:Uncharacterized protein n=1 Tax=Rhynchosporium agropyri TaxID=914238 RepID=A0A1E1LDL1_9HELO|nr:uncharacterized protein RAG0_13624 [Rhynchosporium agropyri]
MPGSFSRSDSPHPFRLQRPPPPRTKKTKALTTDEEAPQEKPSITPNPPLQTRYIDMLLQLDTIPKLHNILAGVFSWLLLAGYLVLPGTFTSIRNSRTLSEGAAIGFLTTIINIYTARGGHWSITAIVTAAVTGGCTTFMLVLLLAFDIWGMRRIMKEHDEKKRAEQEKEKAKQEEAMRLKRGRGEA